VWQVGGFGCIIFHFPLALADLERDAWALPRKGSVEIGVVGRSNGTSHSNVASTSMAIPSQFSQQALVGAIHDVLDMEKT